MFCNCNVFSFIYTQTYRNVDELMGSLLILTFFLITAIVGVNLTGKKWPFAVAAISKYIFFEKHINA